MRLAHLTGQPTWYTRVLVYARPKKEVMPVAHHRSIMWWVISTAEPITACVQWIVAETLPLDSRRSPMSYVHVKYQNHFEVTRIHNIRVTFLHAETSKHGRAATRRHHMRPWIYGSRGDT